MINIQEQFRIFMGNENSEFKIDVSSDYPSTEESLELLKQKYPEISNQLTMIYNSFKSFDVVIFIILAHSLHSLNTSNM